MVCSHSVQRGFGGGVPHEPLNFCTPPPGPSAINRPARDLDALRRAVAELLSGTQPMALGAEAADVLVCIAAASAERDDVVGHGCCRDQALGRAVSAERFGSKATLALSYAAPSS